LVGVLTTGDTKGKQKEEHKGLYGDDYFVVVIILTAEFAEKKHSVFMMLI